MSKPTKANPKIKYVKKAGQWVSTHFENGKQVQEWTLEKP